MKTIRWGIIGCGQVAEVKSGPGFQKASNSELVAVMRRDGELAKDFARRHGIRKYYQDSAALIHDPEVDAVYIATPPHKHHDYVLKVAAVGKPVYVEKPMALNPEQCRAMIAACEIAGVPLWVAYYRRALPRFLKIKALLESGAIGEVRAVSVTFLRSFDQNPDQQLPWRVQPEIAGGGFFMDTACHTLDILDFILGPIEKAKGHSGNQAGYYPAEDTVSGSFVFKSGIQGAGLWCFDCFERVDEVKIIGTTGKLSFSVLGAEPIQMINKQGVSKLVVEQPKHIQQPLIQSIVNQLNGIGVCPSTGESAARTAWVMDQMMSEWE